MNKYWENEPSEIIDTDKNIIRYWREDGVMQILRRITKKDGEEIIKPGALNLDALRETPGAIEQLQNILSEIA